MSGLEVAAAVASAAISGASLTNDIAQTAINAGVRSVSIHLNNRCKSKILINPQVYTYSGYSNDPPQPTVKSGVTEECAFGSTKGAARGAVGVMTYDIAVDRKQKAVKRLAIMFSVPYNYNHYENLFALGLFDTTRACDKSLYELLYYQDDDSKFKRAKALGSEIRFRGQDFTLIGTMCPVSKAEIKVELWDGKYSASSLTARNRLSKLGKCFFKSHNFLA